MDIEAWLVSLGLGQYSASFRENDIDAATLAALTAEDLKEIGIASVGHRRKLLDAIARLAAAERGPAARPAATELEDERRQVTVLFADLSDFTALSNDLGAEEIRDLLNRYFETVDGIIESYGGIVDKHIGDNVMAVFGAPVAHTDDPERAVRAAFGVHSAMTALSVQMGQRLLVHIGIASGQVVAGVTGSDQHTEYTMTGETVNLASRLNDMAESGETLVSNAVQRATSRIAKYASQGEVFVKGLTKPVRVWVAVELVSDPIPERLAPFVGRRAELAQFRALLDETETHRKGHSILIRGEPGIGKTRLVEEFAKIATERGFELHKSLILDFGVGRGQDAIRSLARSLVALSPDSAEDTRKAAIDRAISPTGGISAENRVFLNDLLDLSQPPELRSLYEAMDAAARRSGVRETVWHLIAAKARSAPLLIVVEDVHWADHQTFDEVMAMAAAVSNQPAILVATSRIEGKTLRQEWLASLRGSPLTTIELQPLKADEARRLARDLIGEDAVNLDAYVERADGNPLFLEQLTRGPTDQPSGLPDTLQGLVLARMDRLGTRDRMALRTASVLGQHFSLDSLRFLIDDETYSCMALMEHQLVRPEAGGYLFAHALIQEGVYSSLVRDRRRALHARAAEWFTDRDLTLHAKHLDRADSASAPIAYLAAAREQAAEARFEHALQLVSRGLELAPAGEGCDLSMFQGELLRGLASIPESITAYQRAIAASHEEADRCRALIGVAEGLRLRDRHGELLATLEQAEAVAEAQGLKSEQARIYQLRGNIHFIRGEVEGCLRVNTASLNLAQQVGSPELEAQALGGLGEAEFSRGRMISAFNYYDRCIDLGRKHGLARVVAANLSMRGQTLAYMNDLGTAMADCRAGVELAAKIRQPRAEMVSGLVAAYVMELTDPIEGERWARASLEIAQRLGARLFEAMNLEYLGRFAAQVGKHEEAEQFVQKAIDILRDSESGVRFVAGRAFGALALVTRDAERRTLALEEGEHLLQRDVLAVNHLWFNRDAIEVCLQTAKWGGVEKYARMLEDYTSSEPLPWSDFFIARGRALAAFAEGKRDDNILRELRRLRDEARRAGLNNALRGLEATLAAS